MPAFLAAFTDSAAILDMGLRYANIVLLFSVPIGLAMVFEKITQAMGRMVTSMVCMLIGCVANIILDPLMIFGIGPFPAMGIEGAALATGIGQCASMAAYLVCWKLQGLPMPLRLAGGAPGAGRLCARMYTVGVPAALNLALASLLVTVLNAILAAFSQTYVLILGVLLQAADLFVPDGQRHRAGIRPLMGYNYGAGEYRRVRQIFAASLGLILAVMAAGTALCFAIPEQLLGLFTPNAETVALGAPRAAHHCRRVYRIRRVAGGVRRAGGPGQGRGIAVDLAVPVCGGDFAAGLCVQPAVGRRRRLARLLGDRVLTAGIAWLIYRRATAFTRRS